MSTKTRQRLASATKPAEARLPIEHAPRPKAPVKRRKSPLVDYGTGRVLSAVAEKQTTPKPKARLSVEERNNRDKWMPVFVDGLRVLDRFQTACMSAGVSMLMDSYYHDELTRVLACFPGKQMGVRGQALLMLDEPVSQACIRMFLGSCP